MRASFKKPMFLFFLIAVAVNLSAALFYPLYDLLSRGGLTVLLAVFHYLFRLLDLFLSILILSGALVASRKNGFGRGLRFLLLLFGAKLLYWLVYAMFLSNDGNHISSIFANFALHFVFFICLHLFLYSVAYLFYSKGENNDFPTGICPSLSSVHKANCIAVGSFFLVSFIQQVIDTVRFIVDDSFGEISLIAPGEWGLIAWDFLFIFISSVLAWILMALVENRLEEQE